MVTSIASTAQDTENTTLLSLSPLRPSSLGFAGTMLLRSDEDMAYTKETGPLNMLKSVGVAW